MITKKEFFDEVYLFDNPERLTSLQWNNLLVMGKKNWDAYFVPFNTARKHEVIKGVELLSFDAERSMLRYVSNLNPLLFLNFSLEHDVPMVLKLA